MLKAILLRKKIDDIKKAIDELRKKDADFETREAELETAISEAETEEDKSAVSEAVEAFESEKSENEKKISDLETQLSDAEAELQEVEQRAKETAKKAEPKMEQRKAVKDMKKRTYALGMSAEQLQEICEREDVKDFLTRTREFAKQERSVKGAELNIPETVVGLMRQKAAETSKLMKYINMKYVSGSARQVVMGTVPEAIWTETIGKFNELSVSFNAVEVDGYKLGGFIAIPNSLIEDSDVNLMNELIITLGQSLGITFDKTVVYGTGVKMMQGFVTRLAQKSKPADYSPKEREWKDLSTSNILQFDGNTMTGEEFFENILSTASFADGKYSVSGRKTWVMNSKTYAKIMGKAIATASTGAYVSTMQNEMPIDRGAIEILDFMKDGDVAVGYLDLYLGSERAGATVKAFDQTLALSDEMLLIGSARYDGKPVIAEGFVLFNIANEAPMTAIDFAADKANAAAAG